MSAIETIRLAIRSLALHKVRALLTMLGVVIGVAAVIMMLSISEGARLETLQQIQVLGVNNIRLKSVKPTILDRKQEEQQNRNWILTYGLKERELGRLRDLSPEIRSVVPMREVRRDVWAGDVKTDVRVVGTTPEFFRLLSYAADEGRLLADLDVSERTGVCVLGSEARRKLFRARPWRGQHVKVGGRYYHVVGVAEEKPIKSSGPIPVANLNNLVYIPFTRLQQDFGALSVSWKAGGSEAVRVEVDEAIVTVGSPEAVESVGRICARAMEREHKLADYEIVVPLELLRQNQRTQRTFTIVMASIAALSLLVGGIGIMNIMLANVAERRKEIGTRRALGARQRDIRRQFLAESVVLSALGGTVGLALGMAGAHVIQAAAGWTTSVPESAVALAFGVAAATGILFGTFPAAKAAALDPIEALRTE